MSETVTALAKKHGMKPDTLRRRIATYGWTMERALSTPVRPVQGSRVSVPAHLHPLYNTWHGMRGRCNSPTNKDYHKYGARGIRICGRWAESFWAFVDDMGPRPPGTSLDRIDNDGNYEPRNCRWGTPTQQSQNQRRAVYITHAGKTQSVTEWARELGINRITVYGRLARGITDPLELLK